MEILFVFDSTNLSIKAEALLLQAEFDVKVMNLPGEIKAGCSIALRLAPQDAEKALALLKQKNIAVACLWRRRTAHGESHYEAIGDIV